MSLKNYKEKRDFEKTREPKGKVRKRKAPLKFVIQRHRATRLHYDLRLEMKGVLKSWAVPKGISMNPEDKRLAMQTEDHPYEYLTFKGVIPEGYGAGIMEIWDTGTLRSPEAKTKADTEKELLKGLHKGELKFTLNGKKAKGDFVLVKTESRGENAWLLIKVRDEFATEEEYDAEDHISKDSPIPKGGGKRIKQGGTIKVIPAEPIMNTAAEVPAKAEKKPFPHFIEPMLAKLGDDPFDSEDWVFELKWDGYRVIAAVRNGKVELYSRSGLKFKEYTSVIEELKTLPFDAVIDGEIVMLDEKGNGNFQYLQNFLQNRDKHLAFFAFDLLYYNGFSLLHLPLVERKAMLEKILPTNAILRYSEHFEKVGRKVFQFARKNKMEGIICKRKNSTYKPGYRSSDWVKIKTEMHQTGVVIGFTKPEKSRPYFGSLILGAYQDGELVHIGSSGGGIKTKELKALYEELEPLITNKKPVKGKVETRGKVVWVKPKLVCEVAFSDWTEETTMRHPKFRGMRYDIDPEDVKLELEEATEEIVAETEMHDELPRKKHEVKKQAKNLIDRRKEEQKIAIEGSEIKLTSLNKLWWPDEGYVKADLIEYYLKVADLILPYLKDRPISQYRTPDGLQGEGFYKKDMGDTAPEWAKTVMVERESKKGVMVNYLVGDGLATLIYLAQVGCIEIHPWSSRVQHMDKPDWIVIDIDPSDKNTFDDVIEVALATKEVLDTLKVEGYPKTSGASGLHIYIPLGAKYSYEQGRMFAQLVAEMVCDLVPRITTLERSLKKRKKTEIYVDYLQNSRGQTLAAPYSARPKPGATVSVPLKWSEVKKGLHPSEFDIRNVFQRFEKEGDLFSGVLGKGTDLKKVLNNMGG